MVLLTRVLAKGRTGPPTADTRQARTVPPSVEAKAISFPSGDQTGFWLKDRKKVSCLRAPPSLGIVKTLAIGQDPIEKAICFQSGETLRPRIFSVPSVSFR